jgi:hypothetical protein
MSAVLGLAWMIWTRHRRGLTILAGGLAFLSAVARASVSGDGPAVFIPLATTVVIGAAIYLLRVFALETNARLEGCESGFPTRLYHLPVRTRTLVIGPMLGGAAAMALLWLVFAAGICRPCGFDETPLGWPALMAAVVFAWFQVLLWSPFPFPGLRLIALVLFLSPLAVVFVGLLCSRDIAWPVWSAALGGLLALAYLAAVAGVSRARRGETGWTWPRWFRRSEAALPRIHAPFLTPSQAQLWLEWRCRGLAFPIVVACSLLFWLPIFSWIASQLEKSIDDETRRQASQALQMSKFWAQAIGLLLFVPPLVASLCALNMGKLGTRKRTAALSAFLAARPLTCWQIVRVKFRLALRCTLTGWAVFVAGLLLWFAFGGRTEEMKGIFNVLPSAYASRPFSTIALLVGGAMLWTWLEMVKGMWPSLTGRDWLVPAGLLNCGQTFALAILGFNLLAHPPNDWGAFAVLLPWLTAAVVVVKGIAAGWVALALWRSRLMPPAVLAGILAAWFLLAWALVMILTDLLPPAWLSVSGLVLGIALCLPLTRLLLMPLAVAWNRHR